MNSKIRISSQFVHDYFKGYYDFYNDLIDDMKNGVKFRYQEINLLSARKTLKTTKHVVWQTIMSLIGMALNYKVAIFAGRLNSKNVPELVAEIKKGLDWCGLERGTHYTFKWGRSRPIFEFPNGSFIKVYSALQSDSKVVNLKGLADSQCDYAIEWLEEATEFSQADRQAVVFAVRGYRRGVVHIRTANPDNDQLNYVKYCVQRLKHDQHILETEHIQRRVFVEDNINKIVQYNTYHVNPYLTDDEINEFESLRTSDYRKYLAWALGIPIGLGESVFGYYMPSLTTNDMFQPTAYSSGVDLGQADTPVGHPTVVELVGINANEQIKPLAEYYHNNANMAHKDTYQLARDIIMFYQRMGEKYPLKLGHTAYVDYGAGGRFMIDVLNKEKHALGMHWLQFVPVDKEVWLIKDRVDGLVWLMTNKRFFLDKLITPRLDESLRALRWKKEPPTDQTTWVAKVVDKDDDAFDSLCYAVMPILKMALQNSKVVPGDFNKKTISKLAGDNYKW